MVCNDPMDRHEGRRCVCSVSCLAFEVAAVLDNGSAYFRSFNISTKMETLTFSLKPLLSTQAMSKMAVLQGQPLSEAEIQQYNDQCQWVKDLDR